MNSASGMEDHTMRRPVFVTPPVRTARSRISILKAIERNACSLLAGWRNEQDPREHMEIGFQICTSQLWSCHSEDGAHEHNQWQSAHENREFQNVSLCGVKIAG